MTATPPHLALDLPSPLTEQPLPNAAYAAPQPLDYLSDLDGLDMSAVQKRELLETLFSIMKSYVALGYGLDPVNKLIVQFERAGKSPKILVNSKSTPTTNSMMKGDAYDK